MVRRLLAVCGVLLWSFSSGYAEPAGRPTDENLDLVHFATRLQRFDELVFKLVPGDYEQARMVLRGLDVLSGEIADYRIRRKSTDPALGAISDRIIKLRKDILKIESASPEAVAQEVQRRTENLRTLSWELGNAEDKVSRLALAASKFEEKTRVLSGRTLDVVAQDITRHQDLIAEGLLRVSDANAMMVSIQERLLASPGIYEYDARLVDRITDDRRILDDMQAILLERKQMFSSVVNAITELTNIDNEIDQYPSAYAKAIADFRAHLILSSPEAFSVEMRQAHQKLIEAERMIEDGRRTEASALLLEARDAYDRWAPTYQRAEELYLAAKAEHDRVDALGARRTSLYAFLFQAMAGSLRDPGALEKAESRGIRKYLRAVEPLHDDFVFFVDRYQTVAETWSYVGGMGLQQRLQALLLDIPAGVGKTKVVKK
ncbi:hypothetical protein HY522_09120 [bacterium]|nr:hypothetical protein [bacterium]